MTVRVTRLIALGCLACTVALWYYAVTVLMPSRWVADLQYFWMAGHAWLTGADPYAPSHVLAGQARFATFSDPFFYPPWALPIFAALALFEPQAAAMVLALASLVSLLLAAALLGFLTRSVAASPPGWAGFAACLFLGGAIAHPFLVIVVFGQLQVVLLLALALWIVAAERRLWPLEAVALVLLALKPPFGGALILWSLMQRDRRLAAVAAMGGVALLAVAGLWRLDPVAAVSGWLANAQAYGTLEINDPAFAAGLGWIGGLIGLAPPLWLVALLIVVAVVIIARAVPDDPLLAAALAMGAVIFCWPGHATDFMLLVPAVLLAVLPGARLPRLILAIGLMAMMQATQIAWIVDEDAMIRSNTTNAAVGTAALIMVIAALAGLSRARSDSLQTTRLGGSSPAKNA